MLSPEVLDRLPSIGFWVVITGFIIGFSFDMLARVAGGSKAVAELLGPLGRWLRKRDNHRKERKRREAVDTPEYQFLQRRIIKLEKLVNKLEREIKKLELVEEVHGAHQDMTSEYLRQDAQWHIDASMIAAEERFKMLPPHISYTKFVRDYREKQGLEDGRRWTDNPEPQQDWKE
jgi:hypothetical protein